MMKNVLFICTANKLRSKTAEKIFSSKTGFTVKSAGTDKFAENPLSTEILSWADVIFLMERSHYNYVKKKFKNSVQDKKLIILNIPDEYDFMDPTLIHILEEKLKFFFAPDELHLT